MTSEERKTDDELMAQARVGSCDAMLTLHARHRTRIMSFAFWMVGDRTLAEDILHDTFLYLLQHLNDYVPQGAFNAYLLRIARSKSVDALRARRRTPATTNKQMGEEKSIIETAPATGPSPDEEIDAAELKQQLHGFLQDLSNDFREVVILRIYERLNYAQISQITGVSESTLQSRMHYALAILRNRLNKHNH